MFVNTNISLICSNNFKFVSVVLKIAIISSRYPSNEMPYNHMFVHMRAELMKKMGYDITILVPSSNKKNYTYQGVTVFENLAVKLIDLVSECDLCYLHLLNINPFHKNNGWSIYKHILKNNVPFAMYVHGVEVQKYGSRMFEFNYKFTDFLKWLRKDLLIIPKIKHFVNKTKSRKNAIYIFPSEWMRKDMEDNLAVKLNDYHIIPNGISVDLFKFHDLYEHKNKLLTLRPLTTKKYAVDVAIEVMRYLPEDFSLDIYGRGYRKQEYQNLIHKYNLTNRVRIIEEFVHRKDLNEFFSNYGVLLSPTRMDAQGVTMCEAMATGLLIATSNNTAIPEFVGDFETGVLSNNPEELAEKIIKVTSNQSLYKGIVEKGRESMVKIDVHQTVSKEIEILKSVLT